MAVIIIKAAVSVVIGIIAGCGAVYIFNKMPAAWLCDYDETPSPELSDPYVQRVKGHPWRWVYAAGFSCLLVRLSFFDVQFAVAGLLACWALLIIGLADLKYMIIPDQFVIMLAVTSLGFIPFHGDLWAPVLGAAAGGGIMLMTSLLGGAAFRKEIMGFGDVKLLASLGLAIGWKGIIPVLIAVSLHSGIASAIGLAKKRYGRNDSIPLGPYICGWGAFYIFVVWPLLANHGFLLVSP